MCPSPLPSDQVERRVSEGKKVSVPQEIGAAVCFQFRGNASFRDVGAGVMQLSCSHLLTHLAAATADLQRPAPPREASQHRRVGSVEVIGR